MTTKVITFRINTDTLEGQIFERYRAQKYAPRQIIEAGLRALEGIEPEPINEGITLDQIQSVVDRLENVVASIQQNGGMSMQDQREVADMLDPQFVKGMRRLVRPGFTMKPEGE